MKGRGGSSKKEERAQRRPGLQPLVGWALAAFFPLRPISPCLRPASAWRKLYVHALADTPELFFSFLSDKLFPPPTFLPLRSHSSSCPGAFKEPVWAQLGGSIRFWRLLAQAGRRGRCSPLEGRRIGLGLLALQVGRGDGPLPSWL